MHPLRLHCLSIARRPRLFLACATRPTRIAGWRAYHTTLDANHTASREITRLTYHSRKRGILETTLILTRFAEDRLPQLSEKDRGDYETIIMSNDWSEWDLYRYLTAEADRLDAPESVQAMPVFWQIRDLVQQEGGVVKRWS